MKLNIEIVAMKDLPDELRRRRAALIDALCQELDTTEHTVEHKPSVKQRQRRAPADELTETVIVDGIIIELAVKALNAGGSLINRLELRYGFVDPEDGEVGTFRRAAEPAAGFDILRLAKRIANVVAEGLPVYASQALLDYAQDGADHITNAFGASSARFTVRPTDHLDEDDFGPLEVTFSGLCSHLVVKFIRQIIKAHERGGCGAPEPVREALARRVATTPDKDLN